MSMTPEETLLAIINDVEALKNGTCDKIDVVKKWTSRILAYVKDIEVLDKEGAETIRNNLNELFSLSQETIQDVPFWTGEALQHLEIIKAKLKSAPRNWLKADKPQFTPDYLKARDKYESLKKAILATENQILSVEIYVDRLHDPITSGRFEGRRHARVTENLRIFYHVDGDFVVFDDIMTKNEFDKVN